LGEDVRSARAIPAETKGFSEQAGYLHYIYSAALPGRASAKADWIDNPRMDEDAVRDVLLVKAIEGAAAPAGPLTEDDRRYATRAATELARWQAADRREAPSPEIFFTRRAGLLRAKLAERTPLPAAVARAVTWRPFIGVALPFAALAAGALLEHVADRGHVNVLAFPLFAIVLWNLIVYLLMLAWGASAAFGREPARRGAWLVDLGRRLPAALRGPLEGAPADRSLSAALGAFVVEWAQRSAPLTRSRAARVLHLSAALFAAGAIAGLYVRGLVFEYRAGWESTFLDAQSVHAILQFFLGPASQLSGLPLPSVDDLAAIRFSAGSGGENAARWIHLYAITVGAVVIVPRLLLAAAAALMEHRRARTFTLDFAQPYFRRLLGGLATTGPVRLRVAPYSYTVDEAAQAGLREVAKKLLGDDADLALRPPIAFGAEESASEGLRATDPQVPLTVAVFSLAATPESENHGVFLERLRAALASHLAVIVDEAGYRLRLGAQAGAAERLAERRNTWLSFCSARRIAAMCIDLSAPDLVGVERELGPALVQAGA
jgi:hypothetical protein